MSDRVYDSRDNKRDMVITQEILDELREKAKASERLRMAMDLRNTPKDNSQRMLNALEPGTVMPIHRHHGSSETVVILRGKIRWMLTSSSSVATRHNSCEHASAFAAPSVL